jgi:hypothetical protein
LAYLKKSDGSAEYVSLSLPLWNKIYEKLFGVFEDLAATAAEDEAEEDELANVPKEKKTKQGYLKDGFVVDSSDTEENNSGDNSQDESEEEDEDESEEISEDQDDDLVIEELGSELSEESYDYDAESDKDA